MLKRNICQKIYFGLAVSALMNIATDVLIYLSNENTDFHAVKRIAMMFATGVTAHVALTLNYAMNIIT